MRSVKQKTGRIKRSAQQSQRGSGWHGRGPAKVPELEWYMEDGSFIAEFYNMINVWSPTINSQSDKVGEVRGSRIPPMLEKTNTRACSVCMQTALPLGHNRYTWYHNMELTELASVVFTRLQANKTAGQTTQSKIKYPALESRVKFKKKNSNGVVVVYLSLLVAILLCIRGRQTCIL